MHNRVSRFGRISLSGLSLFCVCFFVGPLSGQNFQRTNQDDLARTIQELVDEETELTAKVRAILRDGSLTVDERRQKGNAIGERVLEIRQKLGRLRKQVDSSKVKSLLRKRKAYVLLDEFFEVQDTNIGRTFLVADSRVYEFFFDEALLSRLKMKPELSKSLIDEAKEIRQGWPIILREALNTGHAGAFKQHQASVAKFEARLQAAFTKKELAQIDRLLFRRHILDFGIPNFVEEKTEIAGLSDAQKKTILDKLSLEAKLIVKEGNELFVRQIQKLFPGYLDEVVDDDFERLPLIPLRCFLAVLENPKCRSKKVSDCLKNFEIDVQDGVWVFPGPVFDTFSANELTLTEKSIFQWVPKPATFSRVVNHIRFELVDTQIERLLKEWEAMRGEISRLPRNVSELERQKLIFEVYQKYNRNLERNLVPNQLASYKNFIKFHTVFSLGPNTLQEQLESDVALDLEDFESQLDESRIAIREFIEVSEARFTKLVAEELNSISKDELVADWFNDSENAAYERLYFDLLR